MELGLEGEKRAFFHARLGPHARAALSRVGRPTFPYQATAADIKLYTVTRQVNTRCAFSSFPPTVPLQYWPSVHEMMLKSLTHSPTHGVSTKHAVILTLYGRAYDTADSLHSLGLGSVLTSPSTR